MLNDRTGLPQTSTGKGASGGDLRRDCDRYRLLRKAPHCITPASQDIPGLVDRVDHGTGDDLRADIVQLEIERCRNAEVAAAAGRPNIRLTLGRPR